MDNEKPAENICQTTVQKLQSTSISFDTDQ